MHQQEQAGALALGPTAPRASVRADFEPTGNPDLPSCRTHRLQGD